VAIELKANGGGLPWQRKCSVRSCDDAVLAIEGRMAAGFQFLQAMRCTRNRTTQHSTGFCFPMTLIDSDQGPDI